MSNIQYVLDNKKRKFRLIVKSQWYTVRVYWFCCRLDYVVSCCVMVLWRYGHLQCTMIMHSYTVVTKTKVICRGRLTVFLVLGLVCTHCICTVCMCARVLLIITTSEYFIFRFELWLLKLSTCRSDRMIGLEKECPKEDSTVRGSSSMKPSEYTNAPAFLNRLSVQTPSTSRG